MRSINLISILILFVTVAQAQDKVPMIKSNVSVISIQDGDELRKDFWPLDRGSESGVYETNVATGKTKKVTFITDLDKISFEVEAGNKYELIIKNGDSASHILIKANLLNFWNDRDFWQSPAMKTPYSQNISDHEKIAGLSKFWSEAKYNFINFHLVPSLDWDKTYLEFIPRVLATKSTLEYYRILQMFCARLRDGHTNVFMPAELADEVSRKPAIVTSLVENKVIIVQLLDESLRKDGWAVGQEIIEIDAVPAKAYAERNVLPYVNESTPQAYDSRLYQFDLLNGSLTKPVELSVRDGKRGVFKRSLPRLSGAERGSLLKSRIPFEMTLLGGKIAHVKINSMVDEARADQLFAEAFSEISKAEALILDLRENGGGSSSIGYRILSFLIDQPFKQSKWFTREYHPTFRQWDRMEKPFGDKKAREYSLEDIEKMRGSGTIPFLKPVVVLSSPRTASAAEDFLVAFKPLKRGLIIGEPSNGSTGQPLLISLPGGGSARICSKYDSFSDGTAFVGIGVIPDILARPKVSDFIEGRDSVLELAVLELSKQLKK